MYLLAGGVVKVFVHNRSYGGHITLAPGIFNIYVYLLCESDKVGSGEVGILLFYNTFYLFGSVGRVVPPPDFFLVPPIVEMIIITTTMPIPIITETGSTSPL